MASGIYTGLYVETGELFIPKQVVVCSIPITRSSYLAGFSSSMYRYPPLKAYTMIATVDFVRRNHQD